jgi:hypothetical protein
MKDVSGASNQFIKVSSYYSLDIGTKRRLPGLLLSPPRPEPKMVFNCQNGFSGADLVGLPRAARATRPRGIRVPVKAFLDQQTPLVGTQSAIAENPKIPVSFLVNHRVEFGEHLKVVGSEEALGGWEVNRGLELQWAEGHVWSGERAAGSPSRIFLGACPPV